MNEVLDRDWMGNEEDEIYKENILDHFRHPRNFGKLEDCTIKNRKFNPACGDTIEISIAIKDNKVKEVKFFGRGCAISMASASMLTEKIKNMSVEELKNVNEGEVLEMIGVPLGVVRMKCGLLSLRTLKEGIEKTEVKKYEQIRS
jgi:nitrogen fixation protein NifU and related proteins